MRKILLFLFGILSLSLFAQNGLDSVYIEKYYVSNAADSIGSIGTLPVGSCTYRIYVCMKTGYKFEALYGVTGHEFRLSTTTSFFNNEDRGATTPNGITANNTKKNSVMLDSWFSVGATATGKMGVLKTEDTDGSIGNADGILQNTDPWAGIPIMTQDGMINGSPEAVTTVGLTTELNVFDATSQYGNLFTTSNGSVASLNGSYGPTSINRVLVGQFTTDGKFCYKLNIQIGTPSGGTQNYVAENPSGNEIQLPCLIGCIGGSAPAVSITSPLNNAHYITGDTVYIAATASDPGGGTITSVDFFVDGNFLSTDTSSPYNAKWQSTIGTHTLTAKATNDAGMQKISSGVAVIVANNAAPTVNITSPANNSSFVPPNVISISAAAADMDGTVDSVEFFVNGNKIGADISSPYTASWTSSSGTWHLTAVATDDRGAKDTSSIVTITDAPNIPPKISITSPSNLANYITGDTVLILTNATDTDGTVDSVEFFISSFKISSAYTSPFQFNWIAAAGIYTVTATAHDNRGAATSSSGKIIKVKNNMKPTVQITNPPNGAIKQVNTIITLTANAADADGTVDSVEYFFNSTKIGTALSSPYPLNFSTVSGKDTFIAIATDNRGAQTISSKVIITVIGGTGINEEKELPTIIIYPVPATDILTIEIGNSLFKNSSCNLYDEKGVLVFRQEVHPVIQFEKIDLSRFAKGTYILELFLDDLSVKRQIIKN